MHFIDNANVKNKSDHFTTVTVMLDKVIESWRASVFSFEWLDQDGRIKGVNDLAQAEQEKRLAAEKAIAAGDALETPVLGIGILDNIEIGSGRALLMTLADQGQTEMPVHIPVSCLTEFEPFMLEQDERKRERGSILFYILLAVGLLAALSYAVLQTTRGGVQHLSKEQVRLHAAEIIDYSNAVANAVAELRIDGVSETNLCFDAPNWPVGVDYTHAGCADNDHKIFHIDGGGVVWQEAPKVAMDADASPDYLWRFSGSDHVTELGSCTDDARCAELIATVDELNQAVCEKINDILGIPSTVTETQMDLTPFQGVYSDGQVIGAAANSPIAGKKAACIYLSSPDKYLYYRVLQVR